MPKVGILVQTTGCDSHHPLSADRFMCAIKYCGETLQNLVIEHNRYYVKPDCLKTAERTVDGRRHPRVSCKNMLACVRTELSSTVVEAVNISRSGMCFRSVQHFWPGTMVLIATHYVEDGQNIFQNARIVRARYRPAYTEYGVEF